MLAFHSPEAMQHNFVLEFHTNSVEQHQLPIKRKPYCSYMNETLTEPPLARRGHKTQGLTHLIGRQGKHV